MFFRLLYFAFRVYCFIFRPIRMGVRVLMVENGKVVLIRHTYMSGWFMPGGGLKKNETLEQAARREAFEETGAALGEIKLMGAYTNFKDWRTDHNVVFTCDEFKITGKPDGEIAEMRLFPLDELPEELLPGHRRRLTEYQAGISIPQYGEW